MLRLIIFFIYICGYLIYSVPKLRRVKKLPDSMPVSERDKIIHELPKYWSKNIMKITGSNVQVEGEELIPDGPVVLISNHEGDFDVPVLLGYLSKPFGFVSKMEVKKAPIIRSWMEVMSCTFMDRNDRRQAIRSIRESVEMLKNGHSMVIFPEGTRSKGGPVAPFKAGSFRLAIDAKVPIVPISILGTSNVFEKNGRLIKPANIYVKIGKPITSHLENEIDGKELAEQTRQVIITNIEQLKNA